jgi:nickel transport protein
LRIILDTGEGHRAEWLLTAEEYIEELGVTRYVGQLSDAAEKSGSEKSLVSPSKNDVSSCNEEMIARIIDEALDRKLAPVKQMIRQSQEKGPRLQDIIGGVGYIIGLAGIAAYMAGRKKNR